MTSARARSVLTVHSVRRLVDHWSTALARQAPMDELLPHLANGLLLELPDRTLRGVGEFQTWYRESGARSLADARPVGGDVRIRLASPIHAQVTITDAPAPPGLGSAHQAWWVVLQAGAPRIRSVVVRQPAPAGVLSSV
ncbi:hypothetical protein GCM10010193_52230 [Kitasatospora atroaurantiaca]|uniref:SnoaL-like protein n=1 Tax=Kitasatospora atroaurantiaca TaxID=285545 RepID=A0A561EXR6_9ACTN|nr:hypothetical protein [Kitasatospora atroaurantiaca]TWE20403.1 hypothetical protein FB465_5555 [Kitasatospora atroaurantiaca]